MCLEHLPVNVARRGRDLGKGTTDMTMIHTTTTKRFIAAFGIAAAAAVAPALLLAGAGTAHADDCYGDLVLPPKSWRVSYAAFGWVLDSLIS